MRLNVINDYTYTLETIVQAGRRKMAVTSVPIRTNPELRPSRLFHSMFGYVKKSILTISRALMQYKPLYCFTILGTILSLIGAVVLIRFLVFYFQGMGSGHIQSLVIACMLITIGVVGFFFGLLGDTVAANRKILEELQFEVRKMDYGLSDEEKKQNEDKSFIHGDA